MTVTMLPEAPPVQPPRQSPLGRARALVRNAWRGLTSMRTALVLLFLLALAAIPGALLPQRSLNEQKVATYIADRPVLGEWMDRFELFDVFSSFWFTAVYALLFISLVGCILPRTVDHYRALRTPPVRVPRNLARLPHHHRVVLDGRADEISSALPSSGPGRGCAAGVSRPGRGSATARSRCRRRRATPANWAISCSIWPWWVCWWPSRSGSCSVTRAM
jgi:hypothetical protein